MEIKVENIKCGGCSGTITKKLSSKYSSDVDVDIELGLVTIDLADDRKDEVIKDLEGMGYPEVNSTEGFSATKAKVKSFISCALGKSD
jgi:copper chaperone CopZ